MMFREIIGVHSENREKRLNTVRQMLKHAVYIVTTMVYIVNKYDMTFITTAQPLGSHWSIFVAGELTSWNNFTEQAGGISLNNVWYTKTKGNYHLLCSINEFRFLSTYKGSIPADYSDI